MLTINDTKIFEILPEDLSIESSYGLQYIIDEIIEENNLLLQTSEPSFDWCGLYDLDS